MKARWKDWLAVSGRSSALSSFSRDSGPSAPKIVTGSNSFQADLSLHKILPESLPFELPFSVSWTQSEQNFFGGGLADKPQHIVGASRSFSAGGRLATGFLPPISLSYRQNSDWQAAARVATRSNSLLIGFDQTWNRPGLIERHFPGREFQIGFGADVSLENNAGVIRSRTTQQNWRGKISAAPWKGATLAYNLQATRRENSAVDKAAFSSLHSLSAATTLYNRPGFRSSASVKAEFGDNRAGGSRSNHILKSDASFFLNLDPGQEHGIASSMTANYTLSITHQDATLSNPAISNSAKTSHLASFLGLAMTPMARQYHQSLAGMLLKTQGIDASYSLTHSWNKISGATMKTASLKNQIDLSRLQIGLPGFLSAELKFENAHSLAEDRTIWSPSLSWKTENNSIWRAEAQLSGIYSMTQRPSGFTSVGAFSSRLSGQYNLTFPSFGARLTAAGELTSKFEVSQTGAASAGSRERHACSLSLRSPGTAGLDWSATATGNWDRQFADRTYDFESWETKIQGQMPF